MRHRFRAGVLVLIGGMCGAAGGDEAPVGFFAASLEAQLEAERVFLATPTPHDARRWLARLTEEPHVAGTPQEKRVAEWVRDRLQGFGLETEIVTYDVYLTYPKEVAVRLIEPEEIELSVREEPLDADKDSSAHGMFPAFHGYAASGEVSGQVVYANYGTPADFEKLNEIGVSAQGKIVLVRYGQVFRGLKVWQAQEHGAAGVIIYSDPADDGYMKGDVYPEGPMRPPSGIQRGSVQFLSHQPGDPSTPGYPSRSDARRLQRAEMRNVPEVPSLPISYGQAEKILRRLGGERVPDSWQGGLPFAYHVGPGGATVTLKVEMEEGLRPIYNVLARIPGSEEPERLVILGNHRDAWTHGAVDPNSGTAAWLEAARGLAAALKTGWRPRRTILLASWDAEEYGLVGSVEWGEDRAEELSAGAVAYVNLDSAVTGPELELGGTPSLRAMVRQAAAAVPEPLAGGSIGEGWEQRLHESWAEKAPVDLSASDEVFEPHLAALGSGSDYTVFLDHLGVPSVNFGFRGSYGVYHSVYDNFRWMEEFGDPQFVYHAAAARFLGLLAMRLAGPELIPFRFGSYADSLRRELDELRRQVVRKKRSVAAGGSGGEEPLAVDFSAVLTALEALGEAGAQADAALDTLVGRQDAATLDGVNDLLIGVERSFLSTDGLPGRPWFRHLLFAPGLTTGYSAWPFPELAEATENADAELFGRGVERVTAALNAATLQLKEIASLSQ
jgi:N-acetylated-alpha-linked acidic dipeptidase